MNLFMFSYFKPNFIEKFWKNFLWENVFSSSSSSSSSFPPSNFGHVTCKTKIRFLAGRYKRLKSEKTEKAEITEI